MSSASDRRAERLERMQAQAKRQEQTRRLALAGGAVAVVVVVIVALVIAKVVSGNNNTTTGPLKTQAGAPAVISAVTHVPATALDQVGGGTAAIPKPISGAAVITANGLPKVLYVGGEFCPYCAATRWSLVVALSRFGTFKNLGETESASDDVYPDTQTLSFHGSSYTSQYLVFAGYETRNRAGQPLDTPTAADEATFEKYDSPPYVPQEDTGSIPFIDFGGAYFNYGSPYNPQTLAGLSHLQIADALKDPSSPVAQGVDSAANVFTAAICKLTKDQPASVCTSAAVTSANSRFAAGN